MAVPRDPACQTSATITPNNGSRAAPNTSRSRRDGFLLISIMAMAGMPVSVERERFDVIRAGRLPRHRLLILAKNEVFDHQRINIGRHETAIRVGWRTDDRLTPNVERCIDQERTAGLVAKLRNELVVAPMPIRVHGLYARRIVDVGDRWNM